MFLVTVSIHGLASKVAYWRYVHKYMEKACFAISHEARQMIGKNKKTNGF